MYALIDVDIYASRRMPEKCSDMPEKVVFCLKGEEIFLNK